MTALLGKAGKRLFAKHLEQYTPVDPLYEYYTNDSGKRKRRTRALPPGLSERDAKILKSVKRRAHYLDKGFNICGFRFGWTFFIGLIPLIGDVTDAALNYYIVVRKARQADLPQWLVSRMLFNNAISAAVGFVPIVGDVILAVYKANSRNAALLEEFLRIRGVEFLKLHAEGGELVEGSKTSNRNVVRKDAEQIKPGAGMEAGEVIERQKASKHVPGALDLESSPPVSSSSSKSGGSKKGFSFFGSSKKTPPLTAGDKGRFIEDVGTDSKKLN